MLLRLPLVIGPAPASTIYVGSRGNSPSHWSDAGENTGAGNPLAAVAPHKYHYAGRGGGGRVGIPAQVCADAAAAAAPGVGGDAAPPPRTMWMAEAQKMCVCLYPQLGCWEASISERRCLVLP